uniref:protein-glutamine gamma-glutamyltransferase n=1 Tax=Leptobrachium leishanense TaxID=445787 RepID=A0A8C5R7D4_9ANUR
MAALQVTSCDWHLAVNKAAHHTNMYDSNNLIIRRGQPFNLTLYLSRALQVGENILFISETGPSPSEESKTKVVFPLFRAQRAETWSAVMTSSASNSLTVTINTSSNSVIGHHILSVSMPSSSTDKVPPQPIGGLFLLFNPWDQDDDVFNAEEVERQEYVLNESGIIFMGSEHEILSKYWEYNQFDKNVLEICFAILDRSINHQTDPGLDVSQRNDPLYVCRVLNATVNSKDENGVLVENWSGNYDDGVNPTSWNGSVPILKEWYSKGFSPVKYGQCWVYGGVLCTVLRGLGIPTRVITNFNSGQDKDRNLFLDLHYNNHGGQDPKQDLMWNFHVWNEAWFKRKDLGPTYNGWQVMDSTPLEKSKGVYCCGPAPLHAIKEGETHINYDTAFMFASVNADLAYWIVYSDGSKKRTANDTKSIGKFISTKAIGSDDLVDVTHTYKHLEGTKEEREVFQKAVYRLHDSPLKALENDLLQLRNRGRTTQTHGGILSGRFTVVDISVVGRDINLILSLKNLTANQIRVIINMTASCIMYTGRTTSEIWTDAKSAPLVPYQEIHVSIPITYAQYGNYLTEDSVFRMTALCEVDGSEEVILVERDISLEKLPITIKLPVQTPILTPFVAEVGISNTLSETLNSCTLIVEGNGLLNAPLQKTLPPLKPGEKYETSFDITPFKTGLRTFLVTFTCNKIKNVKGSQKIMVNGTY